MSPSGIDMSGAGSGRLEAAGVSYIIAVGVGVDEDPHATKNKANKNIIA